MTENSQERTDEDFDAQLDAVRRRSPVSRKDKVKRLAWSMVEATLFRYSFHTWSGWRAMLLRLFGAKIGKMCTIRRTARVYYPWKFEMGDMSCLGDGVEIYNLGNVYVGKRVTISQHAYICGGTHDYNKTSMPLVTIPIYIDDDAWICAKVFVSPGVRIGHGGIAAACSVVIKDVPEWTIVGGNPARAIKSRSVLQHND